MLTVFFKQIQIRGEQRECERDTESNSAQTTFRAAVIVIYKNVSYILSSI